jgi:hypothetical protein
MSSNGKGPIWTGGFEQITVQGDDQLPYVIQFLPDADNDAMQRDGKSPVFYWLPQTTRLARRPNGDYKFFLLHFVGVQDGDTSVGVPPGQSRDIAGGALSFAVTAAPPEKVLAAAHQQLLDKFKDNDNPFWSWHSNVPRPTEAFLRPVPIRSCATHVSNLSLADDASLTVATGLNPWFWKMQGVGPGAISPTAENAYTAMIGSLPAAEIAESLKAGSSLITVSQELQIAAYAPLSSLRITGNWDRVFDHLSTDVRAKAWFTEADVKAEFNNLLATGAVKVDIVSDPTLPGGEDTQKMMTQLSTTIVSQFMDLAKQVIFAPMPVVPATQATDGGCGAWGFGGGLAINYRRDSTNLQIDYQMDVEQMFLQPTVIGGTLDGLFDDTKNNPAEQAKYFRDLYLDDWERKLTRTCHPIVNWPDKTRGWVGDPVAFVSIEVGYPTVEGDIAWAGHDFTPPPQTDTVSADVTVPAPAGTPAPAVQTSPQAPAAQGMLVYGSGTTAELFIARSTMKQTAEVTNPPAGWQADKSFVKRTIHFAEPPAENADPFLRIFVEENEVPLDPAPNGTMTSELGLEVRVDHVGTLNVGPIHLGRRLTADTDIVEVTFQAAGKRLDGSVRPPTKFEFRNADQDTDRYWAIYTGQPDFLPDYEYQVRVIREGTLNADGDEWLGATVKASGNGPLTARVPRKDDPTNVPITS